MWLGGAFGSRRSSAGTSLRGGLTGTGTPTHENSGGELHVGETVGRMMIGLKAPDTISTEATVHQK
jgi:hypothetical protein